MNVADVKRTKIVLNLDRERELKFTLNSFAEMEDRYGSVDAALEDVNTGKIKAIRFMLWVGLMDDDDNLTEKEVGKLIGISDLKTITDKLMEALEGDGPSEAQVKETNSVIGNTPNPNV